MSGHGDIRNLILRTAEQWMATHYVEKHGIVTSYDPEKHLVKVKLMPEGQETGWIQIETGLIGQNYGIVMGPQTGQGTSQTGTGPGGSGPSGGQGQSGNQGDQCMVRLMEGDIEAGKMSLRLHSAQDTPPKCESGEMIFWTKFTKSGGPTPDAGQGGQGGTGQKVFFKKDGSLTVTDGNGATHVYDGKGNIKGTAQQPGMTITHQVVQGQPSPPAVGNNDPSASIPQIAGGGGIGDIGSQLSGLISQAGALSSANVGLPGLNQIGSQILSLASSVMGAGSSAASQITNLAATMANGSTSLGSMGGLVSGMLGQLSGLMNALNPMGMGQVLHMHILDQAKGIIASAFQGQHKTTWDQGGITHTSTTKVTSTAPQIPHNGNTFVSDILQVGKNVISGTGFLGPVFSIFSDARLKTDIKPMGPVLDRVRQLRVSTFYKKFVGYDEGYELRVLNQGEDTFGLIAQEAGPIFPSIVRDNNGILSIDEDKLTILTLKALQELADRVERLENPTYLRMDLPPIKPPDL